LGSKHLTNATMMKNHGQPKPWSLFILL